MSAEDDLRALRIPEVITKCEKRIAAEDKTAILETVDWCLRFGIPVPETAARAFHAAYMKVRNFECDSWDAVFGKPHPGKKLDAHKKRHKLEWKVFWQVQVLRSIKPKPKDIYRKVGHDNNISKETAKRYFEDLQRLVQKIPK